jgi:HK97 family phage major capsid protein
VPTVNLANTRIRLERLTDERERTNEKIEDAIALAEEEKRDLAEFEHQQIEKYRSRLVDLEAEIGSLCSDLERYEGARDVSAVLRGSPGQNAAAASELAENGDVVYRNFGQFARDQLIVRFPQIAALAAGDSGNPRALREAAEARLAITEQRLERVVANTLTTDIAGLLPPTHMAQLMDIIGVGRPVVESGRRVDLESGKLTYPRITQRPAVGKQAAEKTETTSQKMTVILDQLIADTYLGAGDLSWQAINWSTPNALQLWFDLAAEEYARQTELAACSELGTAGGGTITTPLGTTGTESFAAWRNATVAAIAAIYTNTASRAQTNTLYLAANRFFQLATLGTDQTLQVSSVGSLNVGTMQGTWSGLRVVGSYGFAPNTAIVGDSNAFLVGETRGAPVEMRVVEPAIGGWEVGVIGAFKSKVFDPARFIHLS